MQFSLVQNMHLCPQVRADAPRPMMAVTDLLGIMSREPVSVSPSVRGVSRQSTMSR
jgi:hypothetical protein